MTGEEIVYQVAEQFYNGNTVSSADKLLGDFRRGFLGSSSLEAPIDSPLWSKPTEMEKKAMKEATAGARMRTTTLQGPGKKKKEAMSLTAAEVEAEAGAEGEEKETVPHKVNTLKEEGMSFGSGYDIGKGNYDGW